MKTLDPKVAGWLARVAEAIESTGDCNPGYGEFYVSEVTIAFDGDDTPLRLQPNDAGGLDVVIL